MGGSGIREAVVFVECRLYTVLRAASLWYHFHLLPIYMADLISMLERRNPRLSGKNNCAVSPVVLPEGNSIKCSIHYLGSKEKCLLMMKMLKEYLATSFPSLEVLS